MPSLLFQQYLHKHLLAPRSLGCTQGNKPKRHAARHNVALKHKDMLKYRQRMMGPHTTGAGVELGSISTSETKSAWQLLSTSSDAVTIEENSTVNLGPEGSIKLTANSDGLFLTDRGGQGTEIAGVKVKAGEATRVSAGDKVVIGGSVYQAALTGVAGGAEPSERESLLPTTRGDVEGSPAGDVRKTTEHFVLEYGHWLLTLGMMYAGNRVLAKATAAAGIAFPSPLIGMFGIIGVLLATSAASPAAAENLSAFFNPALDWIQKWLPLFYVPTLVVLPISLDGIPGDALLKILAVILVGMPASLLVTAAVAKNIRRLVNTEMEPPEPLPASAPFTKTHHIAWSSIAAASLLAVLFGPAEWATRLVVPYLLACTVEGLLLGNALPKGLTKFLHPLITCAVFTNGGAAAFAAASGADYQQVLRSYITKGVGMSMGGGDILMSFLGVVILSFGFRIFGQRRLMKRHAPEIFGSTILSSAFSLFATAAFARGLGLAPDVARALTPRSVTVALALPIAAQLSAPAAITAAGVALTGLLGSNSAQLLLDKFKYNDPIARGLATAGASHGLGTAALAGKEPEALPFCALAYALMGIISTVLVSIPFIRTALLAITG